MTIQPEESTENPCPPNRVKTKCLNINMFSSLAHARVVISDWKEDCNTRRRHSSLGYVPPAVYAATCTHQ